MTQSIRDFENIFAHAWSLLARNPIVILPGIVLAILAALLDVGIGYAFAGFTISGNGSEDAIAAAQAIVAIVYFSVSVAVSLVQIVFVTGMAGGAWLHGRTSLRDGWSALAHRLPPILFAALLLYVIGFCAAVLAGVTFLVSLGIYAVFFIYTMASVIIGERRALDGVAESCRIALGNLWPTIGLIVLIGLISIAGGWIGSLVGRLNEFAGWLAAGLVQQVIVAYASLVVAGEYLKLTDQPTV